MMYYQGELDDTMKWIDSKKHKISKALKIKLEILAVREVKEEFRRRLRRLEDE